MAARAMTTRRLALLLLILGLVLFVGEVRLHDSGRAPKTPRLPLDVIPAKQSRPPDPPPLPQ